MAPRNPSARSEDVDGAGPGTDVAQAVGDGLGGDLAGSPRRLSGASPRARKAASAEECVQPEPWAAPSGWRSPGISAGFAAVVEEVDEALAVTAGDDDRARAQGEHLARQVLLGLLLGRARSARPPRGCSG